jgi:hypothetical protein
MNEKNDTLANALESAISRTMESMTFEEVTVMQDQREVPVFIAPEDVLWANLPIKSPFRGHLLLEVPVDYGLMLADKVYGVTDEKMSDSAIRDALAEILNTLAGRFLEQIVPHDQVFQLGLPTAGCGELTVNTAPVRTIIVNVGEHYLSTHLFGQSFKELSLADPVNTE